MKIVINKCYGGFSLSPLAVKRLAELQGKPFFLFDSKFKDGKSYYDPIDINQADENLFATAFMVPNPDEYIALPKNWSEMSNKEKDEHNKIWSLIHLDSRPEDRTDKLLIQVVEELGKKANGIHADLAIIEIPDGIEYYIDDYDGNETVHEQHKSWN